MNPTKKKTPKVLPLKFNVKWYKHVPVDSDDEKLKCLFAIRFTII